MAGNVQNVEKTADQAARSKSLEDVGSESGVSCFSKRRDVAWAFCFKG